MRIIHIDRVDRSCEKEENEIIVFHKGRGLVSFKVTIITMNSIVWTIIGIIIVAIVVYYLVKGRGKGKAAAPSAPNQPPPPPGEGGGAGPGGPPSGAGV